MNSHYGEYDSEYMNLKFSNGTSVSNVTKVNKKPSRAAKRLLKIINEPLIEEPINHKITRATKEHSKRGSGKAYIRNYRKFN